MGQALSVKEAFGVGAEPRKPQTAAERKAAATTAGARVYADNLTGEIYDDPSKCVNGCRTLVGEEAIAAKRKGNIGAFRPLGTPPTAEAQTRAELARLEKDDADRAQADKDAKAAAEAEAEAQAEDDAKATEVAEGTKAANDGTPAKASPAAPNKARKQRPSTKTRK